MAIASVCFYSCETCLGFMSFGDSRVVEDYLKVSRRSLLKEVRELRITPEKILRYAQDDIATLDISAFRIKHIPLNRNRLIFRLFQINSIACTFVPVVIS
ncbi:MAG: hypothetical protein GX115_01785 [Ruminiclostridium sp.]|nr:hypothetical protein [Ruminiclostridium sp.]